MTTRSRSQGRRPTDSQGDNRHFLHINQGEALLAPEIGRLLTIALDQGYGAVSIARPALAAAITASLHDRGVDVAALQKEQRYVVLDAATTLSRIIRRGWPDEQLFAQVIGKVVDPMCLKFRRLATFGEMVSLLWEGKKFDEAVRLEQLWKDFLKVRPVILHCAYPSEAPTDPVHADAFRQVCNEHCQLLHAGSPLSEIHAHELRTQGP